jgi:hypothetical protein
MKVRLQFAFVQNFAKNITTCQVLQEQGLVTRQSVG